MSKSLPPNPAATRLPARSARQGHVGPAGRCAGGAAPAPSSAAPTTHSPRAALETHGEKVGTAGCTPGERGYPPLPEAPFASAVLTTINGSATFQCLSAPPDVAGLRPLFRLRAVSRSRASEDEA